MIESNAETALAIQENWKRVCNEVSEACANANRDPNEVTIVGVSKYVGASLTAQLVAAGCRVLGENRPQVLWEKNEWFQQQAPSQLLEFQWHMIGHLQRNKARRTVPMISCLHSLDSLRLATSLDKEASLCDKLLDVFLEVNVSEDSEKTGVPKDEFDVLLDQVSKLEHLRCCGLMAMSTHHAESGKARDEFRQVRELGERLCEKIPALERCELSMGMSGDFREAIAEGATMVRIGSSLWRGVMPN